MLKRIVSSIQQQRHSRLISQNWLLSGAWLAQGCNYLQWLAVSALPAMMHLYVTRALTSVAAWTTLTQQGGSANLRVTGVHLGMSSLLRRL